MGEQEIERLTALDTAFLHQEVGASHMSVGFLATLEGPPPGIEELRDHVSRRLHLIPGYRRRLAYPPAGLGRPVWVDDEHFDIRFHVRRAAVPAPGTDRELWDLHARVFAQRIDRARPLWELYLVEGLEDERWAIISKYHHALNDGVSTVHVVTSLWEVGREPRPDRDGDADGWRPAAPPSDVRLVVAGAREAAAGATGLLRGLAGAARRPRHTLSVLERSVEGVGEVVRAVGTPAPRSPMNRRIGPSRRFVAPRYPLEHFKRVKSALGGTVNDVFLTVVAGGIGRMMRERELPTAGVELRPIVPVSIRTEADDGTLGNRVVTMRPSLPIGVEDPVERHRLVSAEVNRLKRSTQPTVVEVIESAMNWAAPPVLGPVARLAYNPRIFNVLISNIPGVQIPLYLLGRESESFHACGFLAPSHALSVAATSYNNIIGFGIISDPGVVPELDTIVAGIDESLDALLAAAAAPVGVA